MPNQTHELSTPVRVFAAAAEAYYRADWTHVAALCDPISLALFKRGVVTQHHDHLHFLSINGVEQVMSRWPDFTREQAEAYTASLRRNLAISGELRRSGRGIETIDEVERCSPAEVYAAYLEAHEFGYQVDILIENGQLEPGQRERQLRFHAQTHPFVVLGAVMDGDTVAHVLHRELANWVDESVEPGEPDDVVAYREELFGKWEPRVSSCRRQTDGTWRMIAERWLFSHANLAISGGDVESERE